MKKIYMVFSLFLLVVGLGFAMAPSKALASYYPDYGYSGGHYNYGPCGGCNHPGYVDHNYYSSDNYYPYSYPSTGYQHYNYEVYNPCTYPTYNGHGSYNYGGSNNNSGYNYNNSYSYGYQSSDSMGGYGYGNYNY